MDDSPIIPFIFLYVLAVAFIFGGMLVFSGSEETPRWHDEQNMIMEHKGKFYILKPLELKQKKPGDEK